MRSCALGSLDADLLRPPCAPARAPALEFGEPEDDFMLMAITCAAGASSCWPHERGNDQESPPERAEAFGGCARKLPRRSVAVLAGTSERNPIRGLSQIGASGCAVSVCL